MFKLMIVVIIFLIALNNYNKNRILSSSNIWISCYFLIFVAYPIYSDEYYPNSELIDLFALIGILVFWVGSFFGEHIRYSKKERENSIGTIPDFRVGLISYWTIFFSALILLIQNQGISSLLRIIKGEISAKYFMLELGGAESFYLLLIHLLVPCILVLWFTAITPRERKIALFSLFSYCLLSTAFGFTRIFLISLILIIFLFEIRKLNKKKQVIFSFMGAILIVTVLILMNFIRTFGLNSNQDVQRFINIDYVFESTDFSSSYYWFDRLLDYQDLNISPDVYLKPIFVFIPRSIWETKPESLSLQILRQIDPELAALGYSTAGNSLLGEGYAIGGLPLMFFFVFIWGFLCAELDIQQRKRLVSDNEREFQSIYYYIFSVFVIFGAQRGDWSQYMWIVIWFYMLPIYLMSKVKFKSIKIIKR